VCVYARIVVCVRVCVREREDVRVSMRAGVLVKKFMYLHTQSLKPMFRRRGRSSVY